MTSPTIHASAILLGHRGILIRGPSGSGKSRLALALIHSAEAGFAMLVGDDRIHLEVVHGRLLMRPAKTLEGLMEIRGIGIAQMPFEPVAVTDLVVDLAASDGLRLPEASATSIRIAGIGLARLPVAPGADAASAVLSFLQHGEAAAALPQA